MVELYRRKQEEVQSAKDTEQDTKAVVKYQTKQATGGNLRDELTGYVDLDDSNFRWDNLEIGKTYQVYASFIVSDSTFAPATWDIEIDIENGSNVVGKGRVTNEIVNSSVTRDTLVIHSKPFIATATSVRFNVTINSKALIRATAANETFATLEELPFHEETTQWT